MIHIGIQSLGDQSMLTHLQLQVDLEMVARVGMDNLLMVPLITTAPVHHHSVLRHSKREWHLRLGLQEEVALEEALEVDPVELILTHIHMLEIETERNPKHSP